MYTHVKISILVLDLQVFKSHSFVCYAGESQVNAASHNDLETVCTRYITGEWKVPVRLYWWRLCMISWTFMDMTWEEKVPALLPWLLWWCITDTIVAKKIDLCDTVFHSTRKLPEFHLSTRDLRCNLRDVIRCPTNSFSSGITDKMVKHE